MTDMSNVRAKLEKDVEMDRKLNRGRSTGVGRLGNSMKTGGLRELKTNYFNNPIIDGILQDGETVVRNPTLVSNINKLRENSLLNMRTINSVKYKNGLNNYIINDIHSKSTNPGYVRTAIDGRFFTR